MDVITILEGTAIFLAFFIFGFVVLKFVEAKLRGFAKKTKTDIDDKIIEILSFPSKIAFVIAGLYFGVTHMGLGPTVDYWTYVVSFSAITLIIADVVAKIVNTVLISAFKNIVKKTKTDMDDQLLHLAENSVRIIAYGLAIFVILSQLGIDITPLLAGMGIAGLAVSLAAKDTLSNIFGGISIILDGSVRVGDRVKIGEYVGDVIHVGLRSTKILTPENNIVTIPNSKLATTDIVNWDLPESEHKMIIDFSIAYGSDVEKAKKIIEKCINELPSLEKERGVTVIFYSMSDFALVIRAVFFIKSWRDGYATRDLLNKRVYEELEKAGIEIPFPTRTVYLRGEDGSSGRASGRTRGKDKKA